MMLKDRPQKNEAVPDKAKTGNNDNIIDDDN